MLPSSLFRSFRHMRLHLKCLCHQFQALHNRKMLQAVVLALFTPDTVLRFPVGCRQISVCSGKPCQQSKLLLVIIQGKIFRDGNLLRTAGSTIAAGSTRNGYAVTYDLNSLCYGLPLSFRQRLSRCFLRDRHRPYRNK